jgi:hypothetical protein
MNLDLIVKFIVDNKEFLSEENLSTLRNLKPLTIVVEKQLSGEDLSNLLYVMKDMSQSWVIRRLDSQSIIDFIKHQHIWERPCKVTPDKIPKILSVYPELAKPVTLEELKFLIKELLVVCNNP